MLVVALLVSMTISYVATTLSAGSGWNMSGQQIVTPKWSVDMSNRQVFYWQPGMLVDTDNRGNVSYSSCAARHILFESNGYVGKRAKKPLPIHPFMTYNDDLTFGIKEYRTYLDGTTSSTIGPALGTVPHSAEFVPAPDFSGVYNDALEKLNKKIRGDLDISVDLAEIHKTHQMFNATERVEAYTRLFAKKALRGKWGAVKRTAAFLSNHWLEYTYGVKPLLSTVFGALDENLRHVINKLEHHSARAVDYSYRPDVVKYNTMWGLLGYRVFEGNFKLSTTLGVSLTTDSFDPARWSSLNPISIAWELTPYSFVVDWFLEVGSYIRGIETSLLYSNRFRTGYRTDLFAFSGTAKQDYDYTANRIYPGGYQTATGTFKGSRINRTMLTSYPSPYLPSFQAKLGSSRLFSAASLLGQLLGRGHR